MLTGCHAVLSTWDSSRPATTLLETFTAPMLLQWQRALAQRRTHSYCRKQHATLLPGALMRRMQMETLADGAAGFSAATPMTLVLQMPTPTFATPKKVTA